MLKVGEQAKAGSWDFSDHGKLVRRIQSELNINIDDSPAPQELARVPEQTRKEPSAPKTKDEKQQKAAAAATS